MSERIRLIECEGYTILSVDYSDLPEGEYLDAIDEVTDLLVALQRGSASSPMLLMANVVSTQTTGDIMNRLRRMSAALDGFRRYAYAVVGERAALKALAKAPPPGAHLSRTEQEARSWLLREARRLEKNRPI
jgi:hypothetical protein